MMTEIFRVFTGGFQTDSQYDFGGSSQPGDRNPLAVQLFLQRLKLRTSDDRIRRVAEANLNGLGQQCRRVAATGVGPTPAT